MGKYIINADSNGDLYNTRLKGTGIEHMVTLLIQLDDIYLMLEIDLNKGFRSEPTGSWKSLTILNDSGSNVNSYVTHDDGNKKDCRLHYL